MTTFQKANFFLILLIITQLSACGGSNKSSTPPSNQNYRIVSIDYDENANDSIDKKYRYEYDENGNNTKVENINFNNQSLGITTIKAFDTNGNILTATDMHTNSQASTPVRVLTFTYNESGKPSSEKYENFEQNQYEYWLEQANVRTYYSLAGDVISINTFTNDSTGNKLNELIDSNNDGMVDKEVNNTYNKNGKLLTSIMTDPNDTDKASLLKEVRRYDSHDNILSITTSQPYKNTALHVVEYKYTYDSHGNILTSSTFLDSGKIDNRIYQWAEISPPVFFTDAINWAGTGCKADSVSVSGENTSSLSILFDSYDAGKDAASGLNRSACSFSLQINVPLGSKVSQLTADWEVFVEGEGELKRKYFLAGQPETSWKNNTYDSPNGDNFTVRDEIDHDSLSTGCKGGQFNLRIDSQVKISKDDSYVAIDSTDLHNKVKFLLRFEPCQ